MANPMHEKMWDDIISCIRSKVAQRELTQSSAGKLLGVSRASVNRWLSGERGSAYKTIDELKSYMRALGIDASAYFGTNDYVQGYNNTLETESLKSEIKTLLAKNLELEIENKQLTQRILKLHEKHDRLHEDYRALLEKNNKEGEATTPPSSKSPSVAPQKQTT